MPASYPNSVKFFTTKVTGQTIEAAHVNEPQDEITAIEQGLLQGLQHDVIPDASDARSVGTPTRQWLQAVLKRLRVGDSPGTTRVRTIVNAGASETWITVNADYDGTNWNRDDTTKPARAIRINDDKSVDYLYASSGANPIAWSGPQLKITSSEVIVGTDPGGTEVLRAQNLRAVAATFTGSVNVVTGPVVVGADPGGGEALRSSSLRTMFATFTGSVNVPNGPIVVGTDPGGSEVLRTQNFRAGASTFISSVNATSGPVTVGSAPSGTEVLRTQNFRSGEATFTSSVTVPTGPVVIGTDPGGTEVLRASSIKGSVFRVSETAIVKQVADGLTIVPNWFLDDSLAFRTWTKVEDYDFSTGTWVDVTNSNNWNALLDRVTGIVQWGNVNERKRLRFTIYLPGQSHFSGFFMIRGSSPGLAIQLVMVETSNDGFSTYQTPVSWTGSVPAGTGNIIIFPIASGPWANQIRFTIEGVPETGQVFALSQLYFLRNTRYDIRLNTCLVPLTWNTNYAVRAIRNGSASEPVWSFNADTDTGLYRPGADILGLTAGGVERARIITAGSGLQLQGDPTASLHAATKQYVDNLQRYHTVQSNGTAQTQRYTLNFTTGLSASDDSTNARTNVSVVNDTTVQKVEVAKAGVLAGTRKRINFIEGQGITITTSDDTTNNKVDVTIASSGASSGAQVRPFLVATSANIPSSDGPLLVRVDEIGETWYELEYPDSTVCRADFEIPAVSFSQIRFVWRTYATSGACRWYFVVREKGNGDVLGSGTVVASGAVNDTAPATANQLKEATVSVNYTPGANKRCAMLGVLRAGTDPADTLAAPARLLWIELL